MLAPVVTKADDRARAERLLAQQEKTLRLAFARFVAGASRIDLADVATRGGIEGVLRTLDRHVAQLGNVLSAVFVDSASAEAAALGRKLTVKAAATHSLTFNPGDMQAARLMEENRLAFVRNLTTQQREATRATLVAGMERGLGPREMARMFRSSIGLTPAQLRQLAGFERAQRALRSEDLNMPEAERAPIMSDAQIARTVSNHAQHLVAARAEAIARTESLRIVGQARDAALRQALEATNTPASLVVREWASAHDARTREAHAAADGQRRYLDEPFDIGGERIMRPGDGGARNSINCRCTTLDHIADTIEEAQRLRAESPS